MVNESLHSEINYKKKTCWEKRTNIQKSLLITVILLILIVLIILICKTFLIVEKPQKLCVTPGCIKTASDILQKIDQTVNPCDDFYNFACGNYAKNNLIPEYKTSISAFSTTEDLVQQQMKSLIEQPIKSNDIRPFVLIKSYYQACMNTTNIEINSIRNLKQILKTTGGWPVLQEPFDWNENEFNWERTLHEFMKIGIDSSAFFRFEVSPDSKNTSRNLLTLNQIYIGRQKLMIKGLNETTVKAYYDYMVEVVTILGANRTQAREEMKNVIDLNIAIAKILVPIEEQRNPSALYNPMTVKELENNFPYIAWLNYLNVLLKPIKKISYDDTIIVAVPSFLKKLGNILANTPKRTLLNYIYWKGVEYLITYMNNELRQKQQNFFKIVKGKTEIAPRWMECTEKSLRFHIAASALYVKNFFNEDAKKNVNEMISNIRQQFQEILEEIQWMDDTTKSRAKEKAAAMQEHVAYPDELLDKAKVEDFYKTLTVSSTNYLESRLNISKFEQQMDFAELDKIGDKNDWRRHVHATDVNAYYDPNENSIQFPAGILQGGFFSNDRPKYLNYGAIGSFIGHEISHAFDDEGKQYDKDGNLVDWWQLKTQTAFNLKAQCIIDQYSNYTVPEVNLNLNGINTQGENIADNGGIKQAYIAYVKWSKKYGTEPNLPGLDQYTPQQMFWISAANIQCGYERAESLKLNILSNYHAPHYYRVIVPLLNSDYFAEDFHCQLGSKMNPEKKCSVW